MCNRITNDVVDPISRQPEFKIAAIKIEKVGKV
jgi:nitrate reductase NapA